MIRRLKVKKRSLLMVFLFAVCLSMATLRWSSVAHLLDGNHLVQRPRQWNVQSYSALQPFSKVVIARTPQARWIRNDFSNVWMSPNGLSNNALNYYLPLVLYKGMVENWEESQPTLPWYSLTDDSIDAPFFGSAFSSYPYELAVGAANMGGSQAGPGAPFPSAPAAEGFLGPYKQIPVDANAPGNSNVTLVPEPSTMRLVALVGLSLCAFRWLRIAKPAPQLK